MIYAEIKTDDDIFVIETSEHNTIYAQMEAILEDDLSGSELHEKCADAADWCELASIGERYEFPGGEITIID